MNASSFLPPLAAFVAVVALIPLALWLLKRTPMGRAAVPGAGTRVVASLMLAPNQRVVTVEVGQGEDRRWLVLGVTPSGIRTLHTLPPQAEPPAMAAGTGAGFAALLAQARGQGAARPAAGAGDDHAR